MRYSVMQEYYNKASATYLAISTECLQEAKTQQAIRYLEKGIDCNRKGFKGSPNHDLAQLLNKLALAHHKKGQYDYARAFQEESVDIVGKQPSINLGSMELPLLSMPKC